MLNKTYKILLFVVSIVFVKVMANAWTMKDITSPTKVESLLIYGTGSAVIMSVFLKTVMVRIIK